MTASVLLNRPIKRKSVNLQNSRFRYNLNRRGCVTFCFDSERKSHNARRPAVPGPRGSRGLSTQKVALALEIESRQDSERNTMSGQVFHCSINTLLVLTGSPGSSCVGGSRLSLEQGSMARFPTRPSAFSLTVPNATTLTLWQSLLEEVHLQRGAFSWGCESKPVPRHNGNFFSSGLPWLPCPLIRKIQSQSGVEKCDGSSFSSFSSSSSSSTPE